MAAQENTTTTTTTTADERNAPLAPVSQQGTTPLMIFFSVWIALAGWIYNFDLGYGGIVLLMPSYNRAFGTCRVNPTTKLTTCSLTALQQSLISVTFLFVALGGPIAGFTGNYLGRRGTIQVGCLLVMVGAGGMLGTAGNFTAYMVCKCIGGVGLGHLISAAPIYGAECTSAKRRGMLMALYNIGLSMGNAVSAAVCVGSSLYTSDLAWQIPIILQIPLGLILGVGVMMFPESPRWLLIKGKEEAARKAFSRFYAKDPYSQEITKQVEEVQYYIELEKSLGQTTSWTEIFHKNDIRRTALSSMILIGLAITGSKFVVPYAAIFLAGVGISNPFLINFIVALCIFAGTFPGPLLIEYGGRRWSMLVGYSGMMVSMLIFAAVSSGLGSSAYISKQILVAFLCIWAFIFGAFIGTSVWIGSAEMHSVRLRTYGQACTTMFYQIFGFAASFYSPYMLSAQYGNMGTNVGYFYFAVTFVMFVLTFLFVPETSSLTLEQIDDYFTSGRPAWKTSTSRNKKIAKGEVVDRAPEKEFGVETVEEINRGKEE